MPTDYCEDYEEVTGKSRDLDSPAKPETKVVPKKGAAAPKVETA